MGTNFTNGTEVQISYLKPGMKIYLNNKWWKINSFFIKGDDINLELEAKFVGSVNITLPKNYVVLAESGTTLGHKGEAFWTNDSSTQKEQKDKMPTVVDTKFGLGSE